MATPIPSNKARFLLPEVALATHGTITHRGARSDGAAVGITSDSRKVVPGGIFVALRGESHDGHAFIPSAIKNGASILVVTRGTPIDPPPDNASIVEVDDTLIAWGSLANAHLTKWRMESVDGRVIAITGSAGKTTTKELTAALLAQVGPTHFTAGNLNNRIGVPAVIFALEPQHQYCVLEMGMSLPGELDAITEIAKPDLSIIVNIGVAHAEGVGGIEGVAQEKGAVFRALGHDGTAIVNTDDEWVRRAARRARVRKVETFGRGNVTRRQGSFAEDMMPVPAHEHESARANDENRASRSLPPSAQIDRLAGPPHYRIIDRFPEKTGSRLNLSCAGRSLSVFLPIPGEAAAIDLIAAIAAQESASRELLSATAIEEALRAVHLEGRGTVRRLTGDIVVLDDSYNANPASMRSALGTLFELAAPPIQVGAGGGWGPGGRRRVAVLGEMKELGELAKDEHVALGDAIADAGVGLVIGCGGDLIGLALDQAAARGVEVIPCSSTKGAAEAATALVQPGDAVLVKGSRSVGAEEVVLALIAKAPEVLPNSSESASDETG